MLRKAGEAGGCLTPLDPTWKERLAQLEEMHQYRQRNERALAYLDEHPELGPPARILELASILVGSNEEPSGDDGGKRDEDR